MLSTSNLSMQYGGKILFKDVSIQLLPKNHYGLVGPNGAGKSTFLKILTHEITPEKGDVSKPSLLIVGSLKQDHYLYEDNRIRDVVLMGRERLWKALQEKEKLLEKSSFTEIECIALGHCEKVIDEMQGYSAESEASQLLQGLGIPVNVHENPLRTLSGGFKLRVLLAQLLFSKPDVLLLDEPTNHLDIFSIRWLEGYLKGFPGTLVLSSHDRHFLNAVCTHIIDLDYGTLTIFKGNYDAFESSKETQQLQKESILAKQAKQKEAMMDFVDRFKAKASKATQAQSRLKMVEKLEAEMESNELQPSARRSPNLQFEICRPSGAIALKAHQIAKQYGERTVLKDVSFEIERGERVAFVGPNGIGKSTLLEILMGNRNADMGTFEWGYAVQNAYFPQDHAKEIHEKMTLLNWLSQWDPLVAREGLQKVLARSLFSGDDVEKTTSILSGGEKARLILAKMMLIKHNVLVFDEPTNHLDMEAIEALLKALENYEGTILFVSHNRYFVEKLATRIIEMTSEGVKDYRCSYIEYVEKSDNDHLARTKATKAGKLEKDDSTNSSKQTYLDQKKSLRQKEQGQRKIETIERKCHQLESELKALNETVGSQGFYTKTSKPDQEKLFSKKDTLELELKRAYEEWEKAMEFLG